MTRQTWYQVERKRFGEEEWVLIGKAEYTETRDIAREAAFQGWKDAKRNFHGIARLLHVEFNSENQFEPYRVETILEEKEK